MDGLSNVNDNWFSSSPLYTRRSKRGNTALIRHNGKVLINVKETLVSHAVICGHGRTGSTQILSMAHISNARVLALTCSDPMAEITATTYARRVNPEIDVIVRLPEESVAERLQESGVSEVVAPALEASQEFARHTLRHYSVDSAEIEGIACPFLKEREGDITPQDQKGHSL